MYYALCYTNLLTASLIFQKVDKTDFCETSMLLLNTGMTVEEFSFLMFGLIIDVGMNTFFIIMRKYVTELLFHIIPSSKFSHSTSNILYLIHNMLLSFDRRILIIKPLS